MPPSKASATLPLGKVRTMSLCPVERSPARPGFKFDSVAATIALGARGDAAVRFEYLDAQQARERAVAAEMAKALSRAKRLEAKGSMREAAEVMAGAMARGGARVQLGAGAGGAGGGTGGRR